MSEASPNQQEKKPEKLIKTGDIYQLGDHRLLCGNASDVPERLFDSKVRMICTDPPYGVAYVENKKHLNKTIGSNIACENIKSRNENGRLVLFTDDNLD